MSRIPVVYRQALTGERLRHYGSWAKYVPMSLLQRVGSRLPEKALWQELIPCGGHQAELSILASPGGVAVPLSAPSGTSAPTVYSHNLGQKERASGRTLALSLLRQLLPTLARQLELFGDRLSIALAVAAWERAFWVLGLEPYARSITVFLQAHERTRTLSQSGLALRQTGYASGKVDAHVLITSPACLSDVARLSVRQGTLLLSTDGLTLEPFFGCISLDLGLPEQLGLPQVIWAEQRDQFPVLEAVVVAAFLAGRLTDWPTSLPRQISAMDRALAWSEWPCTYRLISAGKATGRGEIDDGTVGEL